MERTTSLNEARAIMGSNFIGPNELRTISVQMGIEIPKEYPNITFSVKDLMAKKEEYVLILGLSNMNYGDSITLKSLRERFGINPQQSEPCFYNQDWYLNESFINRPLKSEWNLVRKKVIDESRGKDPDEFGKFVSLPTAVLCAYTFFCYYFYKNEYLWKNDFVWCNDFDENYDRIYVGRYFDPMGLAKNGFSIHRHLKIKKNYGII